MRRRNTWAGIGKWIGAATAVLLSCSMVSGMTYYVAPNGNHNWSGMLAEANAGKSDGPLATLEGARKAVRSRIAGGLKEPVTVQIRGGEYSLDKTVVFGPEDSGTEKCPVTYQAYENEKPVFTGGVKLVNWKKVTLNPEGVHQKAKGNLWYCDIPSELKGQWQITSLYDDLKLLPRSRSPQFAVAGSHKQDVYNAQPKDLRKHVKYGDPRITFSRTITYENEDLKNWENLSDIEIYMQPKHRWLINLLPLESIDPATKTATFTVEPTYGFPAKNKYQIDNAIEYLDEPGEWCFNSVEGRVYFWPPGSPEAMDIRAPFLQEFIRVEGIEEGDPVRHLNFEGLTFRHGLRDTWLPGDKGLQHDWEMYDKGNAILRMRHAEHCSAKGCTFEASSGTGVRLDLHSQHNNISDNVFAHLGATGILLSGYAPGHQDVNKYNVVSNNYIHHVGQIYRHAPGIFVAQSGHNLISHNTIHDIAYNGMVISGCRPHELAMCDTLVNRREWVSSLKAEDIKPYVEAIREDLARKWINSGIEIFEELLHARENRITDNEIYRVMLELHDGNGIYFSGMGKNNVAERNYIHDTHTTMGFIRLDDNSGFTYIRNNVFVRGTSMLQIKWDCEYLNNFAIDVREVASREWHPLDLKKNVFYNRNDPEAKLVSRGGDWKILNGKKVFGGFKSVSDSVFYLPKGAGEFEVGTDYMAADRKGGADVGLLFADPMFDEDAFEQKIFRFLPGSPCEKLGIQPLDLSKVGSTVQGPNSETRRVVDANEGKATRKAGKINDD